MLIYEHWSPAGSFEEIMFFSLKPVSGGRENRLNMKWKPTFSKCGRCSFQFSLEVEAILEHHSLFMAFIIYCLYLACVEQAENLLQMHLTPVSSGWQQRTAQKHWPQCCRCKFTSFAWVLGQVPQHEFNWKRWLCLTSAIPDGFDASWTTFLALWEMAPKGATESLFFPCCAKLL